MVKNFESQIFSGASIQTNTHNIDSLQKLEGVVRVWSNNLISLAPLEPTSFSDAAAATNYTTHNTTGVNKLHERGIYGQGVKVGVVDTGTWYNHPAVSFHPGISLLPSSIENSLEEATVKDLRLLEVTISLEMAVSHDLWFSPQ